MRILCKLHWVDNIHWDRLINIYHPDWNQSGMSNSWPYCLHWRYMFRMEAGNCYSTCCLSRSWKDMWPHKLSPTAHLHTCKSLSYKLYTSLHWNTLRMLWDIQDTDLTQTRQMCQLDIENNKYPCKSFVHKSWSPYILNWCFHIHSDMS
jgi:hypothetical protein